MNNSGKNDVIGFFVGLTMLCVGGYFFMANVEVYGGNMFTFNMFGRSYDGLIFVPLIASIIFLFFKYCFASKVCCVLSLLLIVANVIMNLKLYWNATSLFTTVVIFVLFFGGLGLVCKTLFANPEGSHGKNYKNDIDEMLK